MYALTYKECKSETQKLQMKKAVVQRCSSRVLSHRIVSFTLVEINLSWSSIRCPENHNNCVVNYRESCRGTNGFKNAKKYKRKCVGK